MLIREDDAGVLAIGQQAHAWMSGQLARAWGNAEFGTFEPWEEVCLAAGQHDAGWAPVDLAPLLDDERGLPRSFMDMPLEVHLDLWTRGPTWVLTQSAYGALLVSLHGWRLYERRDLATAPAEDAAAIRDFLSGQRVFQRELIERLRPEAETLERNSLLVWSWDYLSLALCLGWAPATARGVPTAKGTTDVQVASGPEPGTAILDPWPFRTERVRVHCQGRRLNERFTSEPALREGLDGAPWETLALELVPA